MTREEIIKGLLGIHAVTANYKGDQVILHNMPMPKLTGILYGAAELLKAQEPVKPVFDAGDGTTIGQFLCGKCHAKIGFGHPHFCWYCGRAVKWE